MIFPWPNLANIGGRRLAVENVYGGIVIFGKGYQQGITTLGPFPVENAITYNGVYMDAANTNGTGGSLEPTELNGVAVGMLIHNVILGVGNLWVMMSAGGLPQNFFLGVSVPGLNNGDPLYTADAFLHDDTPYGLTKWQWRDFPGVIQDGIVEFLQ